MSTLQLHRAPLFGSLFDDFFADLTNRNGQGARNEAGSAIAPVLRARMDVVDRGDEFEIKADLPGVKREDIHVTIEGPRVSISAESKSESESESKDKSGRVLHAERHAARYARSFELPVEVNDAAAKARFEDGVLTLALPKKAAVVGKRLEIN